MRAGLGYDIHKLQEGSHIVLGGVKIPYDKSFVAHSDGDVLVHAIIDGILGALGERDIGYHFPDTDPKYKGANSLELLKCVMEKFEPKIINLDSNIIAQKPKLMPHIENMKENLSNILKIDKSLISIKAKTKEGLDATGECRAIEANCIILLEK